MRKLIWVLSLLACCASASLGQAAQEYPKNELFVGYSFNTNDSQLVPPASAGDDSLNGFDIAYTRNINKVVGVTVDFSGHFNQEGF